MSFDLTAPRYNLPVHPDEQAIRTLIHNWSRATAAGDLHELMSLMADDVVFLTPGQAPMSRDEFAAGFMAAIEHVKIETVSEVQEIEVANGWAWCWNYLEVKVTPHAGGTSNRRSGFTLTILRRQEDEWVIARDANLLAPSL
jgi:uncharacterized protein (TIGR02246 family)